MDWLVVFDFDWSLLIDKNSDVFIMEELAPEIAPNMHALMKEKKYGLD